MGEPKKVIPLHRSSRASPSVEQLHAESVKLRDRWLDRVLSESDDGGQVYLEHCEAMVRMALHYQSVIPTLSGQTQLEMIRHAGILIDKADIYRAAARRDAIALATREAANEVR